MSLRIDEKADDGGRTMEVAEIIWELEDLA
jgi:hypothetical protein